MGTWVQWRMGSICIFKVVERGLGIRQFKMIFKWVVERGLGVRLFKMIFKSCGFNRGNFYRSSPTRADSAALSRGTAGSAAKAA